MIKAIHIFDFDGTVVDSTHRYKTKINESGKEVIDLDFWIENEDKTLDDKPLPLMAFVKALKEDKTSFPLIATARIWCDQSKEYAKIHGLDGITVFARKDRTDKRGGAALKIQGVKKLLNLKQFRGVTEIHIHEDNESYMKAIVKELNAIPHFYPSNQGH